MIKRALATIFLFCLLAACASPTPASKPEVVQPSPGSTTPSQALSPTSTSSPTMLPTSAPSPQNSLTPTPGSDLAIKRIAQLGGSIHGIQMVGDVAYVGMGSRLAAIDISQHEKPMLISQSEPLPGLVTQVLQLASEPVPLLLVNAGNYLVVMGVSTPGKLKPVGQLELPGAISALVWDDKTRAVYAAGSVYQSPKHYAGFVSAVGADQETRLKLINTISLPEMPSSLVLGQGYLYAGAGGYEGGLFYIQVSTNSELSTPRLVIPSTPENPFIPFSMQVIGERLYLSYMGFEAYDISNPEEPVRAWGVGAPGGPVIDSFTVYGDQVYVFGWTILSEYVRYALTVREPIEGDPVGETASVTVIHHGSFLVAYNSLQIYDTADLQDLSLVGSFHSPVNNAISAVANENSMFVVDNGAGDGLSNAVLKVLSLPDLNLSGEVETEIPNSEYLVQGIAVEGDRVYIADKDRAWVYDVGEAKPALEETLEPGNGEIGKIAALNLEGARLLAISQQTKESSFLTIYDMTVLQLPTAMDPLTLEKGEILQLAWDGSGLNILLRPQYEYKFVMLYRYGYDGISLTLKESLKVPGYSLSMAANQRTFALAGSGTLAVAFAQENGSLELKSQTTLPEYGLGVGMLKDTALVVVGDECGAAQLFRYDLQDPAQPVLAEAIDIPISNLYQVPVLVTSQYVILVNGTGGIEVLEYK